MGRGATLRLLTAVGLWAAVALAIPGAEAHHSIQFAECSSVQETPEPDPEPEPPDPEQDPDATPTPTPAPTPGGPPPSSSCVPESGAVLRGTHELRFSVDASGTARGPIHRVEAYILSEEEGVAQPNGGQPVLAETHAVRDDAPREAEYTVDWDTRELTPYNGAYTFEVHAWAHNFDAPGSEIHQTTATRNFLLVDNAPRTPSAPRIAVVTESSVSVEWSAAPELDVIGYTLYRASTATSTNAPAPEEFEPLLTTTKRAVRDDVPGPGAYWYKVQVTRRSVVTPSEGIRSRLSAASTAGVVAGLQAAPRPEGEPPPPPPRRPIVIPRASASRPAPVPEAPFSAYLPFDVPEARAMPETEREADPGEDPRTGVLPVAVGAFLLSAALAIGRMPY